MEMKFSYVITNLFQQQVCSSEFSMLSNLQFIKPLISHSRGACEIINVIIMDYGHVQPRNRVSKINSVQYCKISCIQNCFQCVSKWNPFIKLPCTFQKTIRIKDLVYGISIFDWNTRAIVLVKEMVEQKWRKNQN